MAYVLQGAFHGRTKRTRNAGAVANVAVGSSLIDPSPRPPAPPWQRWDFFSILVVLVLVLGAGCSSREEPVEVEVGVAEILGEINMEYLTTDEFLYHFKAHGGMELAGPVRDKFKRWLLAELVDRALLVQAARRHRIRPSRREVQRAFAKLGPRGWEGARAHAFGHLEDEIYERRQIEALFLDAIPSPKWPTRKDIARYLEEHREEFQRPVQVRLSQIVVHSPAEVKAVQAELSSGLAFAEVLRRRAGLSGLDSVRPPAAARESRLRWVGESDLPKELWEAIREAPGGKPAGPVESPYGTIFLYVEERRQAGPVSAAEARVIARKRIVQVRKQRAMAAYLVRLRNKARIKIDLKTLEAL